MFASQHTVPRLPIPELPETLERYVRMVSPLLTAEELERTKAAVATFAATDGPVLQRMLQEWDKRPENKSYVAKFWADR